MESQIHGNNKNNYDPSVSKTNGLENSSEHDTHIVNLSNHTLSGGERSLLNKGLGYVPNPPQIDPLRFRDNLAEFNHEPKADLHSWKRAAKNN